MVNVNGGSMLVPIQPGGASFQNTNGFSGQQQGNFSGSNFQNRMNTPFQPRFPQHQQAASVPQSNFVPRKIGQVGGVDVLSTRPATESRPQIGMFTGESSNSSN